MNELMTLYKCKVCGFICNEYSHVCRSCGVASEKEKLKVTVDYSNK